MSTGFRDIMTLTLHWWQAPAVASRTANTIGMSVAIRPITASIGVRTTTASVGVRGVTMTKKTRQ